MIETISKFINEYPITSSLLGFLILYALWFAYEILTAHQVDEDDENF